MYSGRTRRGVALLFVFGSVALLASIASGLHQSSLSDWKVARRELDRARAEAVALSGLTMAEELLRIDNRHYFWFPKEGEAPRGPEGEALPLTDLEEAYLLLTETQLEPMKMDGLKLSLRIQDESGLLNVNRVPGGNLRRLFEVLQLQEPRREDTVERTEAEFYEELAASLEDWRDPDSAPRPQGAEVQEYEKLEPLGYRPRNGPILSLGELAYVKGFTSELLRGNGGSDHPPLERLLTVHGLLSRVNINSAPREILEAIPGIFHSLVRKEIVEELLAFRPYRSRQEIRTVLQRVDPAATSVALPWLDVRSDYFRIIAAASVAKSARIELEVVVRKLPGNRLQRVGYRQR
jgi:type II secretory pathway component PulK